MLSNNKCILVYGLSSQELEELKKWSYKVIEVNPDMTEMTVTDIVNGLTIEIFNENPINEKVILFNNFPENELRTKITELRRFIDGGILAVVTPTSTKWKMNYLIEHLVEEREWHSKK